MKIRIAQSYREPSNLKAHVAICKPGDEIYAVSGMSKVGCPSGIVQFLGSVGHYLPELHNFWAEA